MGTSRWSNDDYTSYARSTNYVAKSVDEVFSHKVGEKLDPRNVKVGKGDRKGLQLRESIISDENPNPTPIILGLDVTGSMGAVAEHIAKIELPKLMTQIHETRVVTDPHVMFMGIDDVFAQGHGALQVSYFEPDLKIVEQLRQMWLVGNGGGNGSESYDLAWYFAGRYTYLQNYEKTGKPGFLFTFGDEPAPFQTVSKEDLRTIFGPGEYESTKPADSLKMAQEKFQVFHVIVERNSSRSVRESWTNMLGNNAIFLRDTSCLTDVVLATMAIAGGADMQEVIKASKCPAELRYAFSNSLQG
jgi:sarcosine oxidase delta subunit